MTSFFPDLNVWLALSVEGHIHNAPAWRWLASTGDNTVVLFCRYTQLGLLRLLTTPAAMATRTITLRHAWGVYDRWLEDPRIEFRDEPDSVELSFRAATAPLARSAAPKSVGDCYLVAFAREAGATLVTFDRALEKAAAALGCATIRPGTT